jgi:multiple sugar transport system permease protein
MIRKNQLGTFLYHAGAILLVLLIMIPFFWMISTSLKSRGALMALPIQWIPQEPVLDNYVDLFGKDGFSNSLFNSVIVSVGSVLVTLISSAMAAFAFSKIEFKCRNMLFLVYLATMMIPAQVLFIPLYLLMSELKLSDSLIALILPTMFKAFAIFMLRQQMLSIPKEYMEAPAVDGAGLWTIFTRIICPMCKPAFATLAIICFMDAWNDYLLPLVMLNTKTRFTLPIILNSLSGQYKNEYNLLMAGALISMIPILFLYSVTQKYFASGLQVGGVKG